MSSPLRSSRLLSLGFAALASVLVACAPPRPGETVVSAAAVPAPGPREAAGELGTEPGAERGAAAAPDDAEALPGQLVCRAKDSFGVTTELHLAWDGPAGHGVIRRVAPSGMITVEKVDAEREGGTILADAPGATDLMAHAAVVRQHEGRTYLRVGGGPPSLCE